MRRVNVVIMIILFQLGLIGCSSSSEIKAPAVNENDSVENVTLIFLDALIKKDSHILTQINESDSHLFPTRYLITDFSPLYKDYKLSDFSIEVLDKLNPDLFGQSLNVKITSSDGKIDELITVKKLSKKYFFYKFNDETTLQQKENSNKPAVPFNSMPDNSVSP